MSQNNDTSQFHDGNGVNPDTGLNHLNMVIQSMLVTFGLAFLGALTNEFTWWTNHFANTVQLSWTSFIQARYVNMYAIYNHKNFLKRYIQISVCYPLKSFESNTWRWSMFWHMGVHLSEKLLETHVFWFLLSFKEHYNQWLISWKGFQSGQLRKLQYSILWKANYCLKVIQVIRIMFQMIIWIMFQRIIWIRIKWI